MQRKHRHKRQIRWNWLQSGYQHSVKQQVRINVLFFPQYDDRPRTQVKTQIIRVVGPVENNVVPIQVEHRSLRGGLHHDRAHTQLYIS
jgi:hypothetical protein